MVLVFYDTQTTGSCTAVDQILQFGDQGRPRSQRTWSLCNPLSAIAVCSSSTVPWLTLPKSLADTDDLLALVCGAEAALLNDLRDYLDQRAEQEAELVAPLIELLERQTQAGLRPLLRKPLKDVRKEMKTKDRHIRGHTLEVLPFKLMRLVGLTYVAARLRGIATGGADVGLVFESTRLVFSRWQIQC